MKGTCHNHYTKIISKNLTSSGKAYLNIKRKNRSQSGQFFLARRTVQEANRAVHKTNFIVFKENCTVHKTNCAEPCNWCSSMHRGLYI